MFLILSNTRIPNSRTIFPNSMPRAYMLGMVITYSVGCQRTARVQERNEGNTPPSSGLPNSRTLFSPSIVVDTLFPRNLLLGRSSPSIMIRLAGRCSKTPTRAGDARLALRCSIRGCHWVIVPTSKELSENRIVAVCSLREKEVKF